MRGLERPEPLALQGFVLAGGRSTRMGRDKALVAVGGRPMVEIALERLRGMCAEVAMVGNREDLRGFGTVVGGERGGAGPAAGVEAGMRALTRAWGLFTPVDVPLVPAGLLHRWAEAVLRKESEGVRLSYLCVAGERQPTFCLLHRSCGDLLAGGMEAGERRLDRLFAGLGAAGLGAASLWVAAAEEFVREDEVPGVEVARWFSNVNAPEDLEAVGGSLGDAGGALGMVGQGRVERLG